MNKRLIVLGVWLTAVVLAAVAPIGVSSVSAEEPDRVGWWNKAKTGPLPTPVLDPAAPAGSIQIAADPSGEAAVAALHYPLTAGTGSLLTLTSSKPLLLPPDAVLQACEVFGSFEPVENGAWETRPQYGGRCVTGEVEGDTVSWDLPGDLVVGEFGLNVALVPLASPVPFQVTFNPPDASSLVVTSSSFSDPEPQPEPVFDPVFDPVPAFVEPPPVSSGFTEFTPPVTAAPPVAPPTTVRPRVVVPTRPVVAAPEPFKDTSRGERVFAVVLLGALLAAWWYVGSQPGRGPRLLGAPAAATPGVVNVQSVKSVTRHGGVGRFARVRTAAPRRL